MCNNLWCETVNCDGDCKSEYTDWTNCVICGKHQVRDAATGMDYCLDPVCNSQKDKILAEIEAKIDAEEADKEMMSIYNRCPEPVAWIEDNVKNYRAY